MTSDTTPLAQRLLEVAHLAEVQANNRAILGVIGKRMSSSEKRMAVSRLRSAATVIAVLRELSDYIDKLGSPIRTFDALDLTELADSIEKGGPDHD